MNIDFADAMAFVEKNPSMGESETLNKYLSQWSFD